MIFTELSTHKRAYAILLLLVSLCASLYVVFPSMLFRVIVAITCGLSYTVWGISTHNPKHLTTRLVLEYGLIGSIGAIILISLLGSV